MALSGNAAKALDQAKMALSILYGANYFTEEEFAKVDYLLHKGNYVLTNGPARALPLVQEEELISFGELADDGTESLSNKDETPNATSLEPSSDEENAPNTVLNDNTVSKFDMTEQAVNASSDLIEPKIQPTSPASNSPHWEVQFDGLGDEKGNFVNVAESPRTPSPEARIGAVPGPGSGSGSGSGLPPGITQAQLDQARSMQAAMTKAGQKTKPVYKRYEESLAESRWTDDVPSEVVEEAHPSPGPSERLNRINSWASDVDAQKVVETKALIETFIKAHGREPKSVNDVYQPNNSRHLIGRPVSRASNATSRTATVKSPDSVQISTGAMYEALCSQAKNHPKDIKLDVRVGDHIKVLKFVSGSLWVGTNTRTQLNGQFSEAIFKRSALVEAAQPASPVQVARSVTSSTHYRLENIEESNAAEWDEAPMRHRTKPLAAPAAVRPAPGGLSSSRFSILADQDESNSLPVNDRRTPGMQKEIEKLVEEKINKIFKANGMATPPAPAPAPTGPRYRNVKETLKPVAPKTNTCYFWSTNKGCRFTAEECRDIHAHVPGEPTNLYKGRPTWGALADSIPASPSDSSIAPDINSSYSEREKGLTCYYWATDGKCNYTAESCKYLHGATAKGVAPKPNNRPNVFASKWRRGEGRASGWDIENTGEDNDNETEVADGWGRSGEASSRSWETPLQSTATWGPPEDQSQTPQDEELERKALIEAVGW